MRKFSTRSLFLFLFFLSFSLSNYIHAAEVEQPPENEASPNSGSSLIHPALFKGELWTVFWYNGKCAGYDYNTDKAKYGGKIDAILDSFKCIRDPNYFPFLGVQDEQYDGYCSRTFQGGVVSQVGQPGAGDVSCFLDPAKNPTVRKTDSNNEKKDCDDIDCNFKWWAGSTEYVGHVNTLHFQPLGPIGPLHPVETK